MMKVRVWFVCLLVRKKAVALIHFDLAAADDSEESESHEEDDEDDMETVDVNPGVNASTTTMDVPET